MENLWGFFGFFFTSFSKESDIKNKKHLTIKHASTAVAIQAVTVMDARCVSMPAFKSLQDELFAFFNVPFFTRRQNATNSPPQKGC